MRKIYPKEWVSMHPYTKTGATDNYYCRLVNRIIDVLYDYDIMEGEIEPEDEIYEDTAIFLVGWFEDIISQTGVWQVFTSQCEKRYGSRLPFYEPGEDYYPDEINVEDVRFILWHCFQRDKIGKKIYNPENTGILALANEIYDIFDEEFETAPVNERLQDYFDLSYLTEDDFLEYRCIVEWFYFNSYINMGCYECYLDSLSEYMEELEKREDLDARTMDLMIYSFKINNVLSGRTPLLAITAPEYLKLLLEEQTVNPVDAPYMNVDSRKEALYLVTDETEDYYLFKEVSDKEDTYKVIKDSIELNAPKLIPGDTVVTSILFKFGKYWQHNGIMNIYSIKDFPELDDIKNEFSNANKKAAYDDFLAATEGKQFVFLKGKEEMNDFIHNRMKYKIAQGLKIPDTGNDVLMLCITPKQGISVVRNYCECIASPDNPYYNKEKAEKNAFNFLTNRQLIPYETACELLDRGYLKDAALNSTKGLEYGKELVRKNGRFMLDYFFNMCREKDLA